jgi:hypothetical protein
VVVGVLMWDGLASGVSPGRYGRRLMFGGAKVEAT